MSDITLAVNGIRYAGWTEVSVSKSIESLCGQFSFATTVKENAEFVIQNNLKLQDKVQVFIDSTKIITGYIEKLDIAYDAGSHSITVAGRDKTGDLIDSSIKPNNYNHQSFVKLVENVLSDNGYTDIKVINNVSNLPNMVEKTQGAAVGEKIIEFLDKYAKKVQALLTTDADGNIVITRESEASATGSLLSNNTNATNILGASISLSSTNRFRYNYIESQSDNNSFEKSSVKQTGVATDKDIRNPRRSYTVMRPATEAVTLQELATWSTNLRKAKGIRYNCRVQDYYSSKAFNQLWLPNELVQVEDVRCQLSGQFLIQGISYSKSRDSGSITEFSIVNKGAFDLDSLIAFNNNFGDKLINKDSSSALEALEII
jgi:prophage tail gpP-like protein